MLIAAGVLASGCTERLSKSQYRKQVTKIATERATLLGKLAAHDLGDVQYFADSQKQVQLLAEDLDAIEPPVDVQQAHDRFVDSMYGLAKVLTRLTDCARQEQAAEGAGETCRTTIEQSTLDDVQNDFEEAYTIYRHEGYDLPKPSNA